MLNDRELAAVLAGLRLLQDHAHDGYQEAIVEVASDGGKLDPLNASEIDALCERLNLDARGVTGRPVKVRVWSVTTESDGNPTATSVYGTEDGARAQLVEELEVQGLRRTADGERLS